MARANDARSSVKLDEAFFRGYVGRFFKKARQDGYACVLPRQPRF
jgi:hypothetical protein